MMTRLFDIWILFSLIKKKKKKKKKKKGKKKREKKLKKKNHLVTDKCLDLSSPFNYVLFSHVFIFIYTYFSQIPIFSTFLRIWRETVC